MEDRQPMRMIKRSDCSLPMHLLHFLVRPLRPYLVRPGKPLPAGSPRLDVPSSAKKYCTVFERKVNDIYVYDFEATLPNSDRNARPKHIYYFAGGGWQSPPASQHWSLLVELHRQLPGTTISLISYPLAPNSDSSASLPQLQTLYTTLLQQSISTDESIILAGDSSGANIALSLVLSSLTNTLSPSPILTAILLISPAVDLCQKPTTALQKTAHKDPILTIPFINSTAAAWTASSPDLAADPLISPVNADVATLAKAGVKVHAITGGYDVLTPDALVFRDKCVAAGVQGEWLEWERQMHCFPLAWVYGLRESKEGKDWIVRKLRDL